MGQGEAETTVNYAESAEDLPVYFKVQPERSTLKFVPHPVTVRDMRTLNPPPSLDDQGFMMARLTDYGPLIAPEDESYRELLQKLIGAVTGAAKVVVKQPMFRWSTRAEHIDLVGNETPATYVHCDFDFDAFRDMAAEMVADDPERERWMSGRYACIQTWRALSAPPQDTPLAVIDRRTLREEDMLRVRNVLGLPGNEQWFHNTTYRYSPDHRWWYISDMSSADLLVFVGYDSADEGLTGCPHSSFENWRVREGTVPRHSCEVRAFVYWG